MYTEISCCRICGNKNLSKILDLGSQMLTGVFPRQKNANLTIGPLVLVKCDESVDGACGLVQLGHSYELGELYGENYGYRSGLNASMVAHLQSKVDRILNLVKLDKGDIVIDIGSNDCTTLKAYPDQGQELIGIDPTGLKFLDFYPAHVRLIPEFFSAKAFKNIYQSKKAKVITSFSMFYDLENPMAFMREIFEVLEDDGVWVFEQSYMPSMIRTNSYDTVCHEHLEFYGLRQIQYMCENVGFHIIDVEFNDINGGSISVTVRKKQPNDFLSAEVCQILKNEIDQGYSGLEIYRAFASRVLQSRDELIDFIKSVKSEGKRIAAIGASTKGNVLLQYCKLTSLDLDCVGEVNQEKYGSFTPNTWIPIVPEDEVINSGFDYLVVLPWHFRQYFENSRKFRGINLVFPLPTLSIYKN